MIYQYDQALPLPTKDLYDTPIMQMALATAKDMYERGEKRIDDFYKKYEDFYSPVNGATEDVYNMGVGKIKKIVDEMYARGEDPLRTAEGRAAIAQAIRAVDVAKINARKQEAEIAKQYIKNRDTAILNGTYDPDVERAVNGGKTFEEWDASDGYWRSTSPVRYVSQDDMIAPLAKALSPEFDALKTAQMKDGFDYSTVSEDRIRQMIDDNIDDLIAKGQMGKYYYDQALKQAGGNPEFAKTILKQQFFDAAKKHTKETREANPYTISKVKADESARLQAQRAALDYKYDVLKDRMQYDIDGNGKLDDEEKKLMKETKQSIIDRNRRGGKTDDLYPNIFRAADRNPGEAVGFQGGTAYDNKVDPASDKILYDGDEGYYVDHQDIQNVIKGGEILSSNFEKFGESTFSSRDHLYIRPSNQVVKRGNKYYMKVTIAYPTINSNGDTEYKYVNSDKKGIGVAYIRVKERDANYGDQQKKDKRVSSGT